MNLANASFVRYWEGGNRFAIIAGACSMLILVGFYEPVAKQICRLHVDVDINNVVSYTFNLFAIQFGALVSLFSLLACRPTEFLNRIRNTTAFKRLFDNSKITMIIFALCGLLNFIVGSLKITPSAHLDWHSVIFLAWIVFSVIATVCYTRTIRLIFLALGS